MDPESFIHIDWIRKIVPMLNLLLSYLFFMSVQVDPESFIHIDWIRIRFLKKLESESKITLKSVAIELFFQSRYFNFDDSYRVFHILPQIFSANHATFPIQMYAITV